MSSQLPWLLLDVGNTAMKWRFADRSGLLEAGGSVPDLTALGAVLEGQEWALACIASVAGDAADAELVTELSQRSDAPVHMATTAPSAPGLVNGYREPESMGIDRWLAMLAARSIHTGPLCVIDAGTAVTIDLISGEGDHQGGYIIPGADLQRRALTADTGRIQVDKLETTMMPGITTEACVGAGVWRSTIGAVRSVCEDYPDHHAMVTGGLVSTMLDLGLEATPYPDLVMEGLRLWLLQTLDDHRP